MSSRFWGGALRDETKNGCEGDERELGNIIIVVSLAFVNVMDRMIIIILGKLSKPRRQRERRQTKGSMSRTIAVHGRCKSLYIPLPFFAKHQHDMAKFCDGILENLGHDGKYFGFPYGIDRWHYNFSLSRVLDSFAL